MIAPRAIIDLDALRHNLRCARTFAPDTSLVAVIKANAYGHGGLAAALALEDSADALGVARVAEGLELREAGVSKRIVVLEGFADRAELQAADRLELDLAVHHPAQLALLEDYPARDSLVCWLKIDSGMHRIGFPPGKAAETFHALTGMPCVRSVAAVMTHLASADDIEDPTTERQLARFDAVAAGLGKDEIGRASCRERV